MPSDRKPLIFISHIHEEGELAKLLKDAIETEFGGFVEVFVSSDHQGIAQGVGIAAGAHFVEAVEDGLVNCVAALYLISAKSISRPWVNFELGAVWCRGAVQKANGKDRIMVLPICHSGTSRSSLPAPLNAMNAINGNNSADLEFAMKSLQRVLGVAGAPLRTDFEALAKHIGEKEKRYTVGDDYRKFVWALSGERPNVELFVETCKEQAALGIHELTLTVGDVFQSKVDDAQKMIASALRGKVTLEVISARTSYGTAGAHNICDVKLMFDPHLIVAHASTILS